MKKLCLEWKPYLNPNDKNNLIADCQALRLQVRRLNKETTRTCLEPIINDDEFWFCEIRLNGYYDDTVASGNPCKNTTVLNAQLEAEELARQYLSKDWYLLNPDEP